MFPTPSPSRVEKGAAVRIGRTANAAYRQMQLIAGISPIRSISIRSKRDELSRTAADIMHRINEISFNSSLMREMRAVAFSTRLIDKGELDEFS